MAITNGQGFNPNQIKNLNNTVKNTYNTIFTEISTQWVKVSKIMNSNWVGPDEQDSENKIVSAVLDLCDSLYSSCYSLMNTFVVVGNNWIDFANTEKLKKGGTSSNTASIPAMTKLTKLEPAKLEKKVASTVIKYNRQAFTESTNFGLANNGGNEIKTSFDTFETTLKTKIHSLFNLINTNQAFLGTNQNTELKTAVNNVSKNLNKVVKTLADVKLILQTKVSQAYNTQEDNVKTSVKNAFSTEEK